MKYVAEYNAKGDKEMINKIVNSTFVFYLGIGVIVCVGVIILGTFYVDLFKIEEGSVEKARLIAYLMAIGALTSWPMRSFGTSLEGLQRYDISAIISAIASTLNAIITVILLIRGYGIIELIFWGIILGAISQIITIIIVKKQLPFLKLKKKYMKFKTLKKIFTFSSVLFIGQIIGLLMLGADRIILGIFVSVGSITYYAVARKIHDVSQTASTLPASALLPAATELDTIGEKEKLKKLLLFGGKYKCALILSTTIILIALAKPLIHFWMGDKFISMVLPTQIFLSYWLLFAAWGVTGSVLLSQEKFKPILFINFSTAIGNIILSLILVQYYEVLGVILGTVIPWFISLAISIPYGIKLVGLNLKDYLNEIWLKTYPLTFLIGVLLYLILIIHYPSSIIELGIYALFGFLVYWVIFYFIGLTRIEKKWIYKLFKRFTSRIQ